MACTDPIASQTRFLGASIQQYTSSIGWGGAGGTCDVTVVEDKCTATTKVEYDIDGNVSLTTSADMFNPPKVGSPCALRFGGFTYTGILKTWKQNNKISGRAYDISLIDPANILNGVQVIVASYNGQTFNVPNLINAYAVLEDLYGNTAPTDPSLLALLNYYPVQKFGGADVNAAGISWNQVRVAIDLLVNTVYNSNYGSKIKFRDMSFFLDISELPFLDNYFRLSGDALSLMDIITQVCEYSGHDFFTELIHANGHYYIRVRTVKRFNQPSSANRVDTAVGSEPNLRLNKGTISSLIGDGTGTIGNSRGLELRDEVTNCFLVGDYRSDMWQIAYDGDADSYTDTIWPYWGLDSYGYPIISSGWDSNHSFHIDSSQWQIDGLEDYYPVTIEELRAASMGMSEWEVVATRRHSDLSSLKLASEIDTNWTNEEDFKQKAWVQGKIKPLDIVNSKKANAENISTINQEYKIIQLFNYVRNFATNYMGHKYMVALPYVASAISEDEPYSIKLNFQATDSAWSDLPILGLATDSLYLEKFRTSEGKIYGFVYASGNKVLDLAQIPQDDYIRVNMHAAYIRCSIDEIIFLDPVARTYPRAVITLPGTICQLDDDVASGKTKEIWSQLANQALGIDPGVDIRTRNLMQPNMQNALFSKGIEPVMPTMAAVPLQSTTLTYGPWIATINGSMFLAPAGQTRYNRDTSLNPWTYGSTTIMNYAGYTLVNTQVTQQQVIELGDVEQAGGPALSRMGQTLIAGGPEVSDIRVAVGINGLTTTYSFRTCVQIFGKNGDVKANALRMNGQWNNKIQRLFAKSALSRLENTITTSANLVSNTILRADRYSKQSSATFFIGMNIEDPDITGCYRNSIGITDFRKCLPELCAENSGEYQLRSGVELGGLIRPYSTKYSDSTLTTFNRANSGKLDYYDSSIWSTEYNNAAACEDSKYDYTRIYSIFRVPPVKGEGNCPITFTTLNPFLNSGCSSLGWNLGISKGHDIEYIVRDGVYPTDLCVRHPQDNYSQENWYRAVALKGPLVIAGWGYDIYGKPVPNSGSNTAFFKENWLRRPQDWKCGPVDLRWDDKRGVWTFPQIVNIVTFTAQDTTYDSFGAYLGTTSDRLRRWSKHYSSSGTILNADKKLIHIQNPFSLSIISGMYGYAYYSPISLDLDNNYGTYELLSINGTPSFTLETIGTISSISGIYNARVVAASWGSTVTTEFYNTHNPVYAYNVPDISGIAFNSTMTTNIDGRMCFTPSTAVNTILSATMTDYTHAAIGVNQEIRSVQNSFNVPAGVGVTVQWASNQGWVVIGAAAYDTPVQDVL